MNPNFTLPDESEWRMRVFDSLSFPTLILTPDHIIIAVNQKLIETYGIRREELIGKTCRDFFRRQEGNEDLPCEHQACPLVEVIKTGKASSMLRRVQHSDGGEHWEDRVFSPILDDEGEVLYIIESIRDVTRSKELKKTSRTSGNCSIGSFKVRPAPSSPPIATARSC